MVLEEIVGKMEVMVETEEVQIKLVRGAMVILMVEMVAMEIVLITMFMEETVEMEESRVETEEMGILKMVV